MSTADTHSALREAAIRVLADHGLELEDIEVRGRGGTAEVRLIVDLPADRTGSVDLDTVSEAASVLNERADADESLLGPDPAVLELTTPGVERPLTRLRHFRRARGRLLLLTGQDGQEHRARLLAVSDTEQLILRREPGKDDRGRPRRLPKGTPERLEIPLADVDSARVQIEFDPPADLEQLLAEAHPTASKES